MTDTTNFYGTDGDDLIDFSKRPLSQAGYSVARAGKGNDTIFLTSGKWAVGGSGNDFIASIGFGIFGIKYDESSKGISLDATKGTVQDGYGNVDSIRGINAFFGSAYDDLFVGSSGMNILAHRPMSLVAMTATSVEEVMTLFNISPNPPIFK